MKKMGYALIVKENEVKHTSQNFSLIHILTFDVKKEYDYNRLI